MNVLIVHAHHEPSSFSSALARTAAATLREAGHAVDVSDLHAMAFDPVSDRRNFESAFDPGRLDQQREERHASRHGLFVPALQHEMDKLLRADLLVLSFPVWWLGMPAIMKGWVDRVFALGIAYGGGRHFSSGVMRGRRAMCVVTAGGLERDYDGTGQYDSMERVLYPIHRGIFEFCGYEVLPPFVAYGPGRSTPSRREADLEALRARMGEMAAAAVATS